MRLTREEEEILAGRGGGPARRALEMQIEVGGFFAAERLVRVTSAHLTGDADSMGDAGLAYVEALARDGGRFVVPTTTNARNAGSLIISASAASHFRTTASGVAAGMEMPAHHDTLTPLITPCSSAVGMPGM